ncbi:MAG TPA: glycosyltransferase family 1 protein [bacterium]|nr:glycosyltransferase family 1 protein [bacterium]HPL95343.1 glycosyltransferase family 1 protein [bacterium]
MTIGVDASRSISKIKKTGVEKVSDELLGEIKKLRNKEIKGQEINFIFYTPEKIDWLPEQNQRILKWPFKFFWTQIRLAFELILHPPQVVFFPVHALPLLLLFLHYSLRITRYYRIIHDIAFKKQPRLYSFKQKLILNLDLWLAKKLCAKIFVPTQAVKNDLLKYAKINSDKIIITPWGYKIRNYESGITRLTSPAGEANGGQLNYGEKKKQILYLGRVEEKKNINNLIKAFGIFHTTHPDYKLILAGKIDEEFKKNHNSLFIIHNSIEFLGFISEEKKYELLRESAALVLVSKEEGFGFPILEAFDFSLPVLASDIPVLKEIGGDACLYADPNSPLAIADKLEKIITDEKLQTDLIIAGHERLKNFDWPKTAEKILTEICNSDL